jgi:PAS domain S-box-containing protein
MTQGRACEGRAVPDGAGFQPGAALVRLAEDAVRLTHTRRAVLGCGTQALATWSDGSRAEVVVATQPFVAGAETYELSLYDTQPRPLTERECGAFQALAEAFRRELEAAPAIPPPTLGALWVRDHVSAALDYVTDAFVLLDHDWHILHVNTQFERITRFTRSRLLGRLLWEGLPDIAGTAFESETRIAMEGTLPRVFEAFSEVLGRWFEVRAFPCRQGLAVLFIDITERRADAVTRADLEHKLLRSQRMESLGTLAGGIAHDFNNILGAILGNAGLLDGEVTPRGAEYVRQIRIAGERARELVQQILTYSRATTREFVRQPLRPLIEDSLRLLHTTLPANVQLRQQLTDEPLAVTFNPAEVQQVVMNLCTNAWHALGPDGGTIVVELRACDVDTALSADVGRLSPGRYAQLGVEDTGVGMGEETRARLFEPFYTTKPRGKGTGLGLHVLHGIVSAHGGAVTVRSALGRGSRFDVYLPATATSEVRSVPLPPPEPPRAEGQRVAYVDDDEVVQLMVHRVLERAGFRVSAFTDPAELVEAVRDDPACFDLLVTDFSMPGQNGLQVAQKVRALCPGIPIIIATGFASDELKDAVARLGRAEVLFKERTFEELGERATRAVRTHPRPLKAVGGEG